MTDAAGVTCHHLGRGLPEPAGGVPEPELGTDLFSDHVLHSGLVFGSCPTIRYSGVGLNVAWPDINNHATLSLV